MSDNGDNNTTDGATTGPQFNERETQLLCWAMQSLKSGPPEIDNEKLAAFAGMSNPRSAGNAWAKIRAKLIAGSGSVPATPKKGGPRKKAANNADVDGASPKKATPRKRTAKVQDVDGEESPKKKGRGKKGAVIKSEQNVKSEDEDEGGDEKTDVKPETETSEEKDDADEDAAEDDEIV